jgi:hypothetical protein
LAVPGIAVENLIFDYHYPDQSGSIIGSVWPCFFGLSFTSINKTPPNLIAKVGKQLLRSCQKTES